MIRPVLYVDLPGIIYALDQRSRGVGRSFARFVCAPDYDEVPHGLGSRLRNLFPVRPSSLTWVSEDHWRLQGVAQARMRPNTGSWDITYLASMTHHEANPQDVLLELIEHIVNAAIMNGMQRVFAHTSDHPDHLTLFQRVGFQCFAHEMLYMLPSLAAASNDDEERREREEDVQVRRWRRYDDWGLVRLHDTVTPRKVQIAEMIESRDLASQFVPRQRTWRVPGLEPVDETYVIDTGERLLGWLRLRLGSGGYPHQIWLMVAGDQHAVADALVALSLERFRDQAPQGDTGVICHVRSYEGTAIDGLRRAGFSHVHTRAILVRQLAQRIYRERYAPQYERVRINYGVKGLGTVQTAPLEKMKEALHASTDH